MDNKIVKIQSKDSYGISWYEHAQPYYGSHMGMRFRIARNPMEDVALKAADKKGDAVFEAIVWPEPYSFENTPDEQKVSKTFSFDMEGKEQMIEWLNEQYVERIDEWNEVRAKY